MGMLIEGLNIIRDLWEGKIDATEIGTGTTSENTTDTDLETPVASSEEYSITATDYSQMVELDGSVSTLVGNGSTITEMIWKKSSPELAASRVTHTGIAKTSSTEIRYRTRWFFRARSEP